MSVDAARRTVRILTWTALACAVVGLVLCFFPSWLPFGGPWVQLGLGIIALVLSFRARNVGRRDVKDYDGRLSLLAALVGIGVTFWSGQAAVIILTVTG